MNIERIWRTNFRRENKVKTFLFELSLAICSLPMLLIECQIKKNMGVRYYSSSSAVTLVGLLVLLPMLFDRVLRFASQYGGSYNFWLSFGTWYLFTGWFAWCAFKRHDEMPHHPTHYKGDKFSLYTGDIHSRFSNFRFLGKTYSTRFIHTVLEPGLFFVLGLILWLLSQYIGVVLILSALCYSVSYRAQYYQGDNFILDELDKRILATDLKNTFVKRMPGNKTNGVEFFITKPLDEDLAEELTDEWLENIQNLGDISYAV